MKPRRRPQDGFDISNLRFRGQARDISMQRLAYTGNAYR